MSIKRLFNDLVSDFNAAKEEAIEEAVQERNFNPINGPISALGVAERVIKKTRANGRGYVPDLLYAGIEMARDMLRPDPSDEEIVVETTEASDTDAKEFEAKVRQIYKSEA